MKPIKEALDRMVKELSESDPEGTRAPYWIIIDPRQNFEVNQNGLHNIASMISGIFFSRESAQEYLNSRRYNFSKNARVYCHSGHFSETFSALHKR